MHVEEMARPVFSEEKIEDRIKARELIVRAAISRYKQSHPKLFTSGLPWEFQLVGEFKLPKQ